MAESTLTDYVHIIFTLFEQGRQQNNPPKPGSPFTLAEKGMIVLFTIFQFRRIFRFKAQRRWLAAHREMLLLLQGEHVPQRTTFSRRYKPMDGTLPAFVAFIGPYVAKLDPAFSQAHWVEAKSLFRALGPVWHQSDRNEGRIPDKLCHLDSDATWSQSAYQGWVYGYGLHLTGNEAVFATLVQVATAAYPESNVLAEKADSILQTSQPATLAADNKDSKALPIGGWARPGLARPSPRSEVGQWPLGSGLSPFY